MTTDPLNVECPTCQEPPGAPCRDRRPHGSRGRAMKGFHHGRLDAARGSRATGRFIGVRDAAQRLGLHENTIRNMIQDGRLTDARVPGTAFAKLDAHQIDALANGRKTFSE